MIDLYREIVRLQESGEPSALATVIGVKGSSPAKDPMKMLVRADGTTVGSVGGGCLEDDIRREALEVIVLDQSRRCEFKLTAEHYRGDEIICGGVVEVFIEPLSPPTVFLFGGGHVSKAVAAAVSAIGFRVAVTDDRGEYVTEERFPTASIRLAAEVGPAMDELGVRESSYVVVMTRGHRNDESVIRALAERKLNPRYVGMIGSRTKARLTLERLRKDGIDAALLDRIRSPIGLAIGAKTSAEIAVSVAAELIQVRRMESDTPTGVDTLEAST